MLVRSVSGTTGYVRRTYETVMQTISLEHEHAPMLGRFHYFMPQPGKPSEVLDRMMNLTLKPKPLRHFGIPILLGQRSLQRALQDLGTLQFA